VRVAGRKDEKGVICELYENVDTPELLTFGLCRRHFCDSAKVIASNFEKSKFARSGLRMPGKRWCVDK